MPKTNAFYTGVDQNSGESVDSHREVFENPVNNNPRHAVKITLWFLRAV